MGKAIYWWVHWCGAGVVAGVWWQETNELRVS